ncbi:MAG: DUF956 family protein [Streptococcaceae bacterium]|jgi:hypothetical protein|nr:DUF956 family protein [Streptococcaceae bacterium]
METVAGEALIFMGAMERGTLSVRADRIEFAFKNPRTGTNLVYPWELVSGLEIHVTSGKKIKSDFSLLLATQTKIHFSSKKAPDFIRQISDKIGHENVMREPTLLSGLTEPFRRK